MDNNTNRNLSELFEDLEKTQKELRELLEKRCAFNRMDICDVDALRYDNYGE